jgi:hypothetical protein
VITITGAELDAGQNGSDCDLCLRRYLKDSLHVYVAQLQQKMNQFPKTGALFSPFPVSGTASPLRQNREHDWQRGLL